MQKRTNVQQKTEAETLEKIDISRIIKTGFFKHPETVGPVGVEIAGKRLWAQADKKIGDVYLRIPERNEYGQRIDGAINFTWTKARFGGKRWWFECPGCLRKIRVLYQVPPPPDNSYGCQRCLKLTYRSRNLSKGALVQAVTRLMKLEEKEHSMRRVSYKGKPTRHVRQLEKMRKRLNEAGACLIERQNDNSN